MGCSITWCAVREDGAESLLAKLGLTPTGKSEEFPESLVSTARLDTGWRVIWYNKFNCPFLRPKKLGELSKEHDLLLCLVEEHVMFSSSEFWSAGKRRWSISHEGEDGPKGLTIEGDPPEALAAIRREMEAAQASEDGDEAVVDYIFEIPLKLAQSLVGFKHDEDCPHMSEEQFVVLAEPLSRKGFFGKLFG